MLALELDKTAVKGFMGKLLREELFDTYEVRTMEIAAPTRIAIDGAIIEKAPGESEGDVQVALKKAIFTTWGVLRPLVYEIIKLSSKPKHVKIVFSHHSPQEVHTNAAALFLNFVYEKDAVSFTTATAQREFALDKSLDSTWDEWVRNFFSGMPVRDRE